jgi:hypothetical protein
MDFLKTLAPTVFTALLGPLGGAAVSAIGSIMGLDTPTQDKIKDAITAGQMTPDQISQIKQLELKYMNDEKERGFRYAELQFKDVGSARDMAIQTKSMTPSILTWIVVVLTLTFEGMLLFGSTPDKLDPIVLGRVLGTLDSALIMVLSFWFGSSSSSHNKDALLAGSLQAK